MGLDELSKSKELLSLVPRHDEKMVSCLWSATTSFYIMTVLRLLCFACQLKNSATAARDSWQTSVPE